MVAGGKSPGKNEEVYMLPPPRFKKVVVVQILQSN